MTSANVCIWYWRKENAPTWTSLYQTADLDDVIAGNRRQAVQFWRSAALRGAGCGFRDRGGAKKERPHRVTVGAKLSYMQQPARGPARSSLPPSDTGCNCRRASKKKPRRRQRGPVSRCRARQFDPRLHLQLRLALVQPVDPVERI